MKKFLAILLASAPMFFSPVRAAEDLTSYIGLQAGTGEADDGSTDFDIEYGMIRLGLMLTDNIAIEYRLGRGSSDDTVDGVSYDLENLYGAYGLYHFNLSESASIYGVLGMSYLSFKASVGGVSDQDDERGLSVGIGARLYGFSVEYVQYLHTSELEARAVAVGYNYGFD